MNPAEKKMKNLRMDPYTDSISDFNPVTLKFKKGYIESKYTIATLPFNIRTFRIISIIAFAIHLLYVIKDSIGVVLNTAPVRAFGILPFFLICYLLTRTSWVRNSPDNFYVVSSFLVSGAVSFQLIFAWMNPSVYTQLSHALPAITYGTFLFSGVKYRYLLYVLGPLTLLIPSVFLWFILDYGIGEKIDVTIILSINYFIAVFAKYNLELFHRKSFVRQEIQEIQQDLIATYANQVDEQKEELKVAKERLEKLNNQKNKFFSIISHDLKGPFNTVTNLAELLHRSNDLTSEEMDQLKVHLFNSSKNAQDLLINLLTWSKTQLDGMTVNKSELSLYEIVEQVIDQLIDQVKNKQVSVMNNVPHGLFITADLEMIKVVIRNLISNAIKYSNPGTEVRCFNSEMTDDYLTLAIEDQGIGISSEKQENLFQLDSMESTKGTMQEPGTGLGLIICKEFAELNDGKLRLESHEGHGTKVYLTLPRAEVFGMKEESLETVL